MTNLQSLSVFVTERLTLAAQEIFKAVEVTVTEYHEEISRSRQENELLKRRLLEAGIDFYSELQPSLSVVQESEASVGQPVCGEPWNQQNEKIQVKLELSAAQEDTQDSQLQIAMAKEPISPKPCLQNEQKMEEMFHVQTTDGSTDTGLLPAGPFMQIKEEPSELVPDLRLETFCESQTSISADPSSAIASSHCSGFEEELDSHRLSSVHKTVRSKLPLMGRARVARHKRCNNYDAVGQDKDLTQWRERQDCDGNELRRNEHMRLYAFKSQMEQDLCKSSRGRPASVPIPDIRMDCTSHWPAMTGKKGRCRVPGCKGIPRVLCMKCNAHLCFTRQSNCFLKFHTEYC